MADELEVTQEQIQTLRTRKSELDKKLVDERGVMADLQSRYTAAAQAQATGSKPKENPTDVQALIDKQTITIDGLEAAIAECEGELKPLLAAMPELALQRNAQIDAANLQNVTAEMLSHGDEVLRLHSELQVHFAAFLALEKQLRAENKHSEAQRIVDTLAARPNYFGLAIWRELVKIQPWTQFITNNVQREAVHQEVRDKKSYTAA